MFDNEKLRSLMAARGFSFYQLWKVTGLGRGSLYRLKDGSSTDPTYATVARIADVLGVSMDDFRKEN
ncbi:helix-turn-helix domain-containing protein [Lacticaseibacillus parakribbianus]|uniref:helix-turn-helix domain-containing protein n=1 Tax=Lacticaseibacillus parakribbianus TaxID=2970927 RepID=UPI003B84542A